ncbi:MAG: N-acetylmuramoyl-L-alanine amidase, partial [Oscillospiraceae bacterium]|nr:N-acetylmuramoyl-L-alanine amidase [Oscillospiraceae bacterium]
AELLGLGTLKPCGASTTISTASYKVGDIVNFTGTTHYVGSAATRGTACKSGKAKITRIASGAAHPYHLVNEGGGCTVYGWVNAADVKPQ